jgi:hypothetical protein
MLGRMTSAESLVRAGAGAAVVGGVAEQLGILHDTLLLLLLMPWLSRTSVERLLMSKALSEGLEAAVCRLRQPSYCC